jgi:exodeoxyribonuclease VII large subunit
MVNTALSFCIFIGMAENINDKKVFSLLEVARSIQKTLQERYTSSFWIKAEMNKLNHYSHSGHSYPELVEKKEGKIIAELRAILWRDDYMRINHAFLEALKEPLKDGITILFMARISFDPVYGLTLRIMEIDPWYSLGELEKEKRDSIERLKSEGIFQLNKTLRLPLLPKRIAIISVETSKGYSDFMKVINGNPWQYSFFQMLFPAVLQGEKAVSSIIFQLNRIRKVIHHFDAVTIIRGGGGDVGLTCYNNYELSREISRFPIPVLTGIGHSTNETVAEMVAFKNAITPTELADFLLQQFHNFSVPVKDAQNIIVQRASRLLREQNTALAGTAKYFRSVTSTLLSKNSHRISSAGRSVQQAVMVRMRNEKNILLQLKRSVERAGRQKTNSEKKELELLQQSVSLKTALFLRQAKQTLDKLEREVDIMSPAHVLKRGYSISLVNGKLVSDISALKPGDVLHTIVHNGTINSTVNSTNKE